jgi:hypothetical protein
MALGAPPPEVANVCRYPGPDACTGNSIYLRGLNFSGPVEKPWYPALSLADPSLAWDLDPQLPESSGGLLGPEDDFTMSMFRQSHWMVVRPLRTRAFPIVGLNDRNAPSTRQVADVNNDGWPDLVLHVHLKDQEGVRPLTMYRRLTLPGP